eukprot:1195214-Prorocentrum_minimum.AAC.1
MPASQGSHASLSVVCTAAGRKARAASEGWEPLTTHPPLKRHLKGALLNPESPTSWAAKTI